MATNREIENVSLFLNRLVKITMGGDLAVTTSAVTGGGVPVPTPAPVPPAPAPTPTPPPSPTPPPAGPAPLDPYQDDMVFCYARQLMLSAYAGMPLYRARRLSDNVEQDIVAGSDRTETASLSAFAGSDSVVLVRWYEQKGSGNHLVQSNPSSQPLIVNAGTILHNIQPDGVDDGLASLSDFAGSVAKTTYLMGVPNPTTPSGFPLIAGYLGAAGTKPHYLAFAIIGGDGNNGLLPVLGNFNGNLYNQGIFEFSYALIADTALSLGEDQLKLYVNHGNNAYHGTTGSPDNNPIDAAKLVYASDATTSSNFSAAQLRAIVGYNVAHTFEMADTINDILQAT